MTPVDAVIPARFASSRLPGKPLLRDTGRPLIEHVFRQVRKAKSVRRVIIATDHQEIHDVAQGFGAEVAMTSPDHPSGTDRVAEVVERLGVPAAINVQGDEPELDPADLDLMVEALNSGADMTTLAAPFTREEDFQSPHAVKVVVDREGFALYFSRAAIPHGTANERGDGLDAARLHVGTYGYTREVLAKLTSLPKGPLESLERLEQLRALENGIRIRVLDIRAAHPGVDTPEDYRAFVERHLASQRRSEISE